MLSWYTSPRTVFDYSSQTSERSVSFVHQRSVSPGIFPRRIPRWDSIVSISISLVVWSSGTTPELPNVSGIWLHRWSPTLASTSGLLCLSISLSQYIWTHRDTPWLNPANCLGNPGLMEVQLGKISFRDSLLEIYWFLLSMSIISSRNLAFFIISVSWVPSQIFTLPTIGHHRVGCLIFICTSCRLSDSILELIVSLQIIWWWLFCWHSLDFICDVI